MLSRPPGSIVATWLPIARTFLAERYRAGGSRATARRELDAASLAAVQLSLEGRPVRLLGSLVVPTDETIYSLFGATSREDVAAVGERTDQPYDRISESVLVGPRHLVADALSQPAADAKVSDRSERPGQDHRGGSVRLTGEQHDLVGELPDRGFLLTRQLAELVLEEVDPLAGDARRCRGHPASQRP